eukprot:650583-Amphidinium_carterae.1
MILLGRALALLGSNSTRLVRPQPTTAEEDAAPPAAGDSDAQTFDDRSVQRVVKVPNCPYNPKIPEPPKPRQDKVTQKWVKN